MKAIYVIVTWNILYQNCQKLHNIFEDFSLFLRNKIVE